ncbi:hypothetical protein [Streptomyces pristinaespiralis]|uniref:hypothetical protein n=1 Tax=Streptomyces pristinaespiralis TaxID=38300 RepID=UPI00340DC5E1
MAGIGAFGESVVKIGLTRRLDRMDRVHELGDAAVPFRFDVHDALARHAGQHPLESHEEPYVPEWRASTRAS